MLVAAFSIVSLVMLGASPALATSDDSEAPVAETVAPVTEDTGAGVDPQATPPTEPIVETPPASPLDKSVPVPPVASAPTVTTNQSVPTDFSNYDTNGPAARMMLAEDAAPEPPYLRWVVVDSGGTSVGATQFTVQGPRDDSVTDKKDEKQWAGGILAVVADNTGQTGYSGADLDPAPGMFLVKTLTSESDTTVTRDVAADEHYRVRPAKAAGLLVGNAAQWVESDVVAELPGPEPTKVTLVADSPVAEGGGLSKGNGPLAEKGVTPLAVGPEQPGGNTPYLYWNVKDTAGSLVGGASFQIARADTSGNFGLAVTTVDDCVANSASECNGADQDPDAGEFQVFDLGTSQDTPIETEGRYKLTTQTPPVQMRFPTVLPTTFTMNGSGGTPANGVWPQTNPKYDFGTLQLTTVGPEPGVDESYLFWTTKSNGGVLTGGSTYSLVGADASGSFNQNPVTVEDCQSLPCNGFDKDPDTGEFQVNRIGTTQDVDIELDTRYRLTPTTPLPAGWTWANTSARTIASTSGGNNNTANWPGPARPNYDFGNFVLNPVTNSGNMPIVVRSRVSANVPLATANNGSATGSVATNLGSDTGAIDAVGTTFRLWTSLSGNPTNDARYNAGPQNPVTAPWATCTTTAASPGACTITIPFASITPANGGTQGNRYWVVEEVAPSGTYSNPTLKIGEYRGPTTTMRIAGITTPVANSTGSVFMPPTAISTSNGNNTQISTGSNNSQLPARGPDAPGGERQPDLTVNQAGSFGAVPNSVNNPRILPRCDVPVTVGIVLDQSASIGSSDWTAFRQSLVGGTVGGTTVQPADSLLGTLRAAGAKVSVLGFGTQAPDSSYTGNNNGWLFPRTGLPGGTTAGQPTVLPAINSSMQSIIPTSRPGGNANATNWHDALRLMASKNSAAHYDLVIFITDGAPNYILGGTGPDGYDVTLRSMEAPIYAANALKKGNTRLVAVGVGAGISTGDQNLRAISGTVKYAGPGSGTSDYYQNASWGTDLRERLAGVVKSMTCIVSVEVSKTTISATGATNDNVADWRFTAGSTSSESNPPVLSTPVTKTTAATESGNPKWDLKLQTPTQQGTITLTENGLVSGGNTSMDGWTLESVACTVGGEPVTVTPNPDRTVTLSGITVESESVYCKFTNREQPPSGSISWEKVSNDTPAEHLAGSEWIVQGPFTGSEPITGTTPTISVTDCVGATPSACTGPDKDERAGYLKLKDLDLGKYRVIETKAPQGFNLPTAVHFDVTINAANPDVNHAAIVNVRILGTVTWGKSDDSGQRLAGSEWELRGPLVGTPPVGGESIVVVDCTSAPCDPALHDTDPNPGYFEVTGLAWGAWTLTETRAPAGHALNSAPHDFSITAAATTYTFSQAFVNVAVEGPNLPLTGGLGRDFFAILGGGVLIVGFSAAMVLQLRKRRREVA